MSNRTKVKKRVPKTPWLPSQTLLAALIFITLGIAILAKSLYLIVPAGVVLLGILFWGGITARLLGAGSKTLKQFITPGILVLVLLVVRIITILGKSQ